MQRPIGGYDNIPGAPDNRIGRLSAGNFFSPGMEGMSLAQNQGPSTPIKYYPDAGQFMPYMGAGRPGEVRLKNPPVFPKAPMAFGGGDPSLFLAQASPGGQGIGNVGGMLGEAPGDLTGFANLLESMQEQNMQNSQGEKDRRSLENYGRSFGNY